MSHWIDSRGHSKSRSADRNRSYGWFKGETSHARDLKHLSPPPSHGSAPPQEEKRALRDLWRAKGNNPSPSQSAGNSSSREYKSEVQPNPDDMSFLITSCNIPTVRG
jgi:hypothetical protein